MIAALLLPALAALAAAAPASQKKDRPAPELVAEVLADPRYEFCHDRRYPLTEEEIRLCPAVRAGKPCPALAAACKAGVGARLLRRQRRLDLDLPAMPGWFRWAVLALLIGGLAALVHTIVRNALADRRARRKDKVAGQAPGSPETVAARAAVETDVERLLARARTAAAGGDFGAAIADVHAALLRTLEGAGLFEVHPSRTNGDYLRAALARRPEASAPLRSFVGDIERVQFGARAADEPLYRSLLERAAPFLGARLPLLLALVSLLGGGCGKDRGDWDHSPSGRAGVMALLRAAGVDARERLASLGNLDRAQSALVLLPGAGVSDEEWKHLHRWVEDEGGDLVIAGFALELPGWLGAQARAPAGVPSPAVTAAGAGEELGAVSLPFPPAPVPALDEAWQPLLVRGAAAEVYAARRELGEGTVLLFADGRAFTNAALAVGDTARLLVALFRTHGKVELVGELTGLVSPNPAASVSRGRLAPFLLQLALVFGLFFLLKGTPFGRLRDPVAVARREFIEHVRAVGQQYARARASGHVLAAYGLYVTERLRERVRLSGSGGLIPLAEAVAARTGRPAGEVTRLLLEAREETADDAGAHLRALAELCKLSAEMGGSAGERRRVQG